MTPESITVSLEWAKKLKEAGWPQEDSYFEWRTPVRQQTRLHFRDSRDIGLGIAAPTAEEILRRLPYRIDAHGLTGLLKTIKMRPKSHYGVCYTGHVEEASTLANAAAAMHCYLAEQKLLPKAA